MSTVTLLNFDQSESDDLQQFEKMPRRDKPAMPVHRSQSAIRASRKSPKSKHVSRKISRSSGGTHRRRLSRFR